MVAMRRILKPSYLNVELKSYLLSQKISVSVYAAWKRILDTAIAGSSAHIWKSLA